MVRSERNYRFRCLLTTISTTLMKHLNNFTFTMNDYHKNLNIWLGRSSLFKVSTVLSFYLHLYAALLECKTKLLNFYGNYNFLSMPVFRISAMHMILVGIWCQNDVVSTSMRRHDVASTLIRRHFYVMCPLGLLYYFS